MSGRPHRSLESRGQISYSKRNDLQYGFVPNLAATNIPPTAKSHRETIKAHTLEPHSQKKSVRGLLRGLLSLVLRNTPTRAANLLGPVFRLLNLLSGGLLLFLHVGEEKVTSHYRGAYHFIQPLPPQAKTN